MKKIIVVLSLILTSLSAFAEESNYSEIHHLSAGGAWASPDGNQVVICDGQPANITERYNCTCMIDWGRHHINKGTMPITVPRGTSFADIVNKATDDCRKAYPASGFGSSDEDMNAKDCQRVN